MLALETFFVDFWRNRLETCQSIVRSYLVDFHAFQFGVIAFTDMKGMNCLFLLIKSYFILAGCGKDASFKSRKTVMFYKPATCARMRSTLRSWKYSANFLEK